MRFVRYQQGKEPPRYGWVYEDQVGPLEGSLFGDYRRLDADIPLRKVRLLSPVQPGKVITAGRNFVEHTREMEVDVPEIPVLFLKPPSAVVGSGEFIVLPPQSHQVEHEAELAVVIGKGGRWIRPEEAHEHILGYTVANDVTARDLQRTDVQWTRAKSFDTFCPLGPWIETELDPADVLITCRVSGELRQMASSREMIFNIPQLIAFISAVMSLEPGDVILSGTPAGVGPLKAGDVVECEVEGIGTLSNPVQAGRQG
jgi:2-keto-4-pentenoate hydratase/2-oxohepta-3-ene-1,7-dioic acid hydratase in catechol pathway